MKKFNLRSFSKRFATFGVMGVMAAGALLPATVSAAPAKCAAGDVKCVITAGDALIAERQTALTTLSGKVAADLAAKKITSDQANVLQSDVTTNKTGLNNLKAKLDAETTERAARADVVNIFLQFRIFAVVLPRDYRHLQLDIEMHVKEVMQDAVPAIKTAIDNAPADKKAQAQALFADYQKQVAAAEAQMDTVLTDFSAMTPENFNLNRASYEATRKAVEDAVRAAHVDLHQAGKDLQEIAHLLGVKK